MAEEVHNVEPAKWYEYVLVCVGLFFFGIGVVFFISLLHDNVFTDSARLDALESNVDMLRHGLTNQAWITGTWATTTTTLCGRN